MSILWPSITLTTRSTRFSFVDWTRFACMRFKPSAYVTAVFSTASSSSSVGLLAALSVTGSRCAGSRLEWMQACLRRTSTAKAARLNGRAAGPDGKSLASLARSSALSCTSNQIWKMASNSFSFKKCCALVNVTGRFQSGLSVPYAAR